MLGNFVRLIIYNAGDTPRSATPYLDFDGTFNARIRETNIKRDLPSFLDGYPRQIAYTNEWHTWEISFPVLTLDQKNRLESLIRQYNNNIAFAFIKRVGRYTGENNIFPVPFETNQLYYRGGTISAQPQRNNPGSLLSGYAYVVELNGYVDTSYNSNIQWGGLTILSNKIKDYEVGVSSTYDVKSIGGGTVSMLSATQSQTLSLTLNSNIASGVGVAVNAITAPQTERLVEGNYTTTIVNMSQATSIYTLSSIYSVNAIQAGSSTIILFNGAGRLNQYLNGSVTTLISGTGYNYVSVDSNETNGVASVVGASTNQLSSAVLSYNENGCSVTSSATAYASIANARIYQASFDYNYASNNKIWFISSQGASTSGYAIGNTISVANLNGTGVVTYKNNTGYYVNNGILYHFNSSNTTPFSDATSIASFTGEGVQLNCYEVDGRDYLFVARGNITLNLANIYYTVLDITNDVYSVTKSNYNITNITGLTQSGTSPFDIDILGNKYYGAFPNNSPLLTNYGVVSGTIKFNLQNSNTVSLTIPAGLNTLTFNGDCQITAING